MSEQVSLVIVPVDGSTEADAATRHAALLANLYQARLHLVHVLPLNPAELCDLPSNRQADTDHDREKRLIHAEQAFAQAHSILDTCNDSQKLQIDDIRLSDEGFVRHPERAIVEHARQHRKSLLVMGARHLSEIGKWVQGSVSNAVVHRAKGPVTVLHADACQASMASIGRILLPTDGSPHSDVAARLAGDLSRSGHIPVELIFCQPPGEIPPLESGETEAQRVFQRTHQALGELPAGSQEQLLASHRYAEAIVEQAHATPDNPVIIMGRRGMRQWQESLLGSISQQVISKAACPVTLVV